MTYQDLKFSPYTLCRIGMQTLMATIAVGMLMPQAHAATLKTSSLINDDVVRLGDIFEGVEKPDTILGKAAPLGKEMVLSSTELRNIARNYKVSWTPESPADQATIKRDTHTISANEITDTLKASLSDRGVEGNFTLTLTQSDPSMLLPTNVEPTLEVANLKYTPDSDVFTATLASPSAAKPLKTLQISGLINRTVSVPALTGSARKGDIISASDIAWVEVPERNVSKDAILDADDLIGKTPQRVLTANRVIRMGDVTNPQLVDRGDDVTIIYNFNGMMLSAKGKSLQNGAQGDLIRVTNLSSAKSLSAEVTGDRTVTVQ